MMSSVAFGSGITNFSFPISFAISFCHCSSIAISFIPRSSTVSSTDSLYSCAIASIMITLPSLPQRVKSSVYGDSPSFAIYGSIVISVFPFGVPMSTAPTGPFHGIGDVASASDAALIARIPGSESPTESTVTITCTAFFICFEKSGRMVRSMIRDVSTASSDGRPSRLLYCPPRIIPAA